mmetsp:Transcript_7988/g.11831  ORF Transcript_7988/g.11831 Transcript_7988/m.11831 type:complete len:114 (-) Transcript_7988:1049-1390(-)
MLLIPQNYSTLGFSKILISPVVRKAHTTNFVLCPLQIASQALVPFNCLEQTFEVSDAKSVVVGSLYDFQEKCWPCVQGFREYLQEVALFVKINEYAQLLEDLDIFLDRDCVLR